LLDCRIGGDSPVMRPEEIQSIIDALLEQRTATLESFFNSHGLLDAFNRPGKYWGREKKVNEALGEADRQGRREEILLAARARFEPSGATQAPRTPESLLKDLIDDAHALEPGDADSGETLLSRARMVVEQLFGRTNYWANLNNVHFRESGTRQRLAGMTSAEVWDDAHRKLLDVLNTALEHAQVFGIQEERATAASEEPREPTPSRNRRSVMVIHGRDSVARTAMFTFLRALGLEPIEWSQARMDTGSASPYVGEILEAAFNRAQGFVVLLTPDDEARLREDFLKDSDPPYERELTPQGRPNVLFEAGMAMGASSKRTVLVQIGNVRPFSDVGGRHVLHFDGSSTEDRQELAMRLITAGCEVSLTGTDWHTAGDFPEP
jgi:predicted nucleotide-binding protein